MLYLIFTEGYAASGGDELVRVELADEAIRLTRILHRLLPAEREVAGLLALLLLVDARRAARPDAAGELVLLAEQDRSRWDRDRIDEGRRLVVARCRAARRARTRCRRPSPRCTTRRRRGDHRLAAGGGALRRAGAVAPSPLVELNRAVAVAMRDGPAAGLVLLDALAGDPRLRGYHLLPAARADLLRRLGRRAEAAAAYRRGPRAGRQRARARVPAAPARRGRRRDSGPSGGDHGTLARASVPIR